MPEVKSKPRVLSIEMGCILNYQSLGVGEPLIIIHGLFGSSRNWNTLANRFAENFRVLTPDLRNHGDSFHSDRMTYQDMVDDILNLMDAENLRETNLLGHSMGGKVAMKLTHENPHRVKKLVVADIAPVAYSHRYEEIINPVFALDLSGIQNRREAEEKLAHSITDQRIRWFILQNLYFKDGLARWKLNWQAIRDNMDEITGNEDISDWKIETPSLFVRGERSDFVDETGIQQIRQHFTCFRIETLPDAGHWLHAEQPQAFHQAVANFLCAKR